MVNFFDSISLTPTSKYVANLLLGFGSNNMILSLFLLSVSYRGHRRRTV